jgi:hypothetical protein
LTGAQLAVFLNRRALAVADSTQPDGRPHTVITSYINRGTTFRLPMAADTAPERNLQANPWLTLTVIDSDHDGYTSIQIEGPAETIPAGDVRRDVQTAVGTWVRAWLRLTATRPLSRASGDRAQAQHTTQPRTATGSHRRADGVVRNGSGTSRDQVGDLSLELRPFHGGDRLPRVSRKCRMRHAYDIDREIMSRGVRTYKTV